MEAFVYCWTDHKTNKLYIGSHKGTPDDGYICSSKLMIEEYRVRPEDFTRQIVAEGAWDDIFKLEGRILVELDAKNDPLIYNLHNGSGDFRNKGHTEATRKKLTGKKHTDITKQKLREKRLLQIDPRLGTKHTTETKDRISRAKLGNKCGAGNKGKIQTLETRRKISEANYKRYERIRNQTNV